MLSSYLYALKLYKIETCSDENAELVASHIRANQGKCIILGSAIVTNYVFESECCLCLVGTVTDQLTEYDIDRFIRGV